MVRWRHRSQASIAPVHRSFDGQLVQPQGLRQLTLRFWHAIHAGLRLSDTGLGVLLLPTAAFLVETCSMDAAAFWALSVMNMMVVAIDQVASHGRVCLYA